MGLSNLFHTKIAANSCSVHLTKMLLVFQNDNETPYSTDESEKSSQSPQDKNNCTKARFSPQNLHFPAPPAAPGLGRVSSALSGIIHVPLLSLVLL